MDLIPLAKFKDLRLKNAEVTDAKLQRWCRNNDLPARKIGGEWYVDIEAFDNPPPKQKPKTSAVVDLALARLRKEK